MKKEHLWGMGCLVFVSSLPLGLRKLWPRGEPQLEPSHASMAHGPTPGLGLNYDCMPPHTVIAQWPGSQSKQHKCKVQRHPWGHWIYALWRETRVYVTLLNNQLKHNKLILFYLITIIYTLKKLFISLVRLHLHIESFGWFQTVTLDKNRTMR